MNDAPAQASVEAELVRAASALLGNLWQDVWSHDRTHEENWKEFDRKYPGAKWLRDARNAAEAKLALSPPPTVGAEDEATSTNAQFAQRVSRLAKEALAWSADTLDLTEGYHKPVSRSVVDRFLSTMRDRLDYIERSCIASEKGE